jgi:hypothetical protein
VLSACLVPATRSVGDLGRHARPRWTWTLGGGGLGPLGVGCSLYGLPRIAARLLVRGSLGGGWAGYLGFGS